MKFGESAGSAGSPWRNMVLALLAATCLGLASAGACAQASKRNQPTSKAAAPDVTGLVSRVVDGDTLVLTPGEGGAPVTVRIEGIDAPESCQPGGREATDALKELVRGKTLTLRSVARDEHARTVGKLFDGTLDVGDRLVRDGHAWSMRFRNDKGPYMASERMARALNRGLHVGGAAVLPREFRRSHGPCTDPSPPTPATAPAPSQSLAAAAQRCDGRTQCSQMTSCAEARWFLANCPGVKMDGNRDGVPCERQWCSR